MTASERIRLARMNELGARITALEARLTAVERAQQATAIRHSVEGRDDHSVKAPAFDRLPVPQDGYMGFARSDIGRFRGPAAS